MLYYDRNDLSERSVVNKTSRSKECDICDYWNFLKKEFNFQTYACNRCHDFLTMSMNLSDIYTLNIKNANYHGVINGISQSAAIKLLQNNVPLKKWNI